jgi:hypothetical protein
MSDLNDDHYIADIHNAHVDTSAFEADLGCLAGGVTGQALDSANFWGRVHDLVMGRLSTAIDQPPDETLICRYLSTTKFLWFLREFAVYFGSAHGFDDKTDCGVPADYNNCVQRFLIEREIIPIAWDDYMERFRSGWLVSSWTELTDHYDDHLLWHCYAGGSSGVGITIRYRDLMEWLMRESARKGLTNFASGKVAYGSPLRIPPFHKRRIFRNEKEVRFVLRSDLYASVSLSIASLKDKVGLRFAPDASRYHIDAVVETWMKWGGSGRYQIAGD